MPDRKPRAPTFVERYTETCFWIDKRKRKWDLNVLDWDDARQIILIKVNRQYSKYDPAKGQYSHWLNRVISNEIKNIWRDHYTSYSRPCILGCVFNTGGDSCSKTPSGRQCGECRLYRDWQRRKESHFNVKQTLPLESHSQEVHSAPSDFIDIEEKKKIIDAQMKERLTRVEYRAYRMLMIQHKTEEETARALGYRKKRGTKSKMWPGYQQTLALRHKFVELAKTIIEEENLAA